MKLIKSSYKIIPQEAGLEGIYKAIERAGRTCYKSEDKITDTSAKEFVNRMIKSGHGAMLEHGTVYLKQGVEGIMNQINSLSDKYNNNKYSKVVVRVNDTPGTTLLNGNFFFHTAYITTNLRVLVENNWMDDLQYICEPTEYHERRVTVHFVCDRGVSHELVRHRVMSFAQESTRYCNYSKDKFNNCVTYILPNWCTKVNIEDYEKNPKLIYNANGTLTNNEISFLCGLYDNEKRYLELLENGWKPQEARAVLPNALKTELVMTGFVSDWQHFFDLRALGTTGAPHPQAKELAEPLMKEFIARKYINN